MKQRTHAVLNVLLRRQREKRHWTQTEVARMLGTTYLSVCRWENGATSPSLYYRKRLCELFEASLEDLGLSPSSEKEASEDFQTSSKPSVWNVPVFPTPLIGREREVDAICSMITQSEISLLTLLGTGGIGKTRLSVEVAKQLREYFADGVCFVALAPTRDPDLMLPTIAQELGIQQTSGQPLLEQMKVSLRERSLLLILDNLEQMLAAAPTIEDLLLACPQIKMLVTSRAVLHLQVEHIFSVPPLSLPDLKELPEREILAHYEAVAFFVQRAQALLPSFQLTQANVQAVAKICVHLDGLPLAIELAAARIRLLSPQELLTRLSHRLTILTSGALTRPLRQQTLLNTIQWSYDLLDSREQQLFRQLSVLVGGGTLEAFEAIYSPSEDDSVPILDRISALLDKSLLSQMGEQDEEPRLQMLETIREYGLTCLQAQGELETRRRAHAAYYVQFAEEANTHLYSMEAATWLKRLEREHENLRAALQWALECAGEEETAARLGWALWRFWTLNGYLSEGRAFLERIHSACERCEPPLQARVLYASGMLAWFQENYTLLEHVCQELVPLVQRLKDPYGIASTLLWRSSVALHQHDPVQARTLLEEALAIAEAKDGDTWVAASILMFLGRLFSAADEYAKAQHMFEKSLALYRTLGYQGEIAWQLIYIARDLISQGAFTRARSLLEEARTLCQEANHKWGLAHALGFLGQVSLEQNDISRAHTFLTESLRLNREVGNQYSIARSLFLLASEALLRGETIAAQSSYDQSLTLAIALDHRRLIASCLIGLAAAVTEQGQLAWAARLWGAADAVRQGSIGSLFKVLRTRVEQAQAKVRAELGNKGFASALADGLLMTPGQVLSAQEYITMSDVYSAKQPSTPAASFTDRAYNFPANLTARELEVLRLVTQGLTDGQVAEQLIISRRTVTSHLTSIYNKLGVSSRTAATRYAMEHRLV